MAKASSLPSPPFFNGIGHFQRFNIDLN